MRLAAHQQLLVDELMHLDDPQERLAAAVERARRSQRLNAAERVPANRIAGCSSLVWLVREIQEGRCLFRGDADSPVVRALVGLLAEFYSNARPAEIVACEVDPLAVVALDRMLTPTRRHGLGAVRAAIQSFAREHTPLAKNP